MTMRSLVPLIGIAVAASALVPPANQSKPEGTIAAATAVTIKRDGPVRLVGSETRTVESSLDRLLSDWERLPAMGCYQCSICGWRNHKHRLHGNPPPAGGVMGAHMESCNGDGTCSDHSACMGGSAILAVARTVRSSGSLTPVELATALRRHPGKIRANNNRKALQLIGCDGNIVASFPFASVPALHVAIQ